MRLPCRPRDDGSGYFAMLPATRCLPLLFGLACLANGLRGGEPRGQEIAAYDSLVQPAHRQHWAFRPVERPDVPRVRDTAWVRNPIDAFVLSRLEARGWKPAPPANPQALLRRLYLDLTGLPPTPAEQETFLRDSSPTALERVIDDLLARPAYGERWARHWLDIVRYADTNGYERDGTKPHVWRYRDYVIRALNADKPYDRFVLEQLAGDELPDASAETLIATGFHRLGPWDDEPADPDEDRFDQLDDLVSTTWLAFQGLTLGCARCHNHKLEPLTQLDYYRQVAVFAPLKRPRSGRTELDLPAGSPAEIEQERWQAVVSRLEGFHPARAAGAAAAALSIWFTTGTAEPDRTLPRGYFLHETSPQAPKTHLLIRGKASRPGPEVGPGLPAVLVSRQPDLPPPGPRTTGRRLALARWMARAENPLTARVIVNRVWQHHFGEGIVRTPSDFGTKGDPPTHRELLDWLADRFVRDGWSLKKLHRLILTSATYQMSKRWDPTYGAGDPEDRLLWRVPYRRLEAEVIRDSALAASGRLNRAMYGPSMYPEVPREALASHSDPDKIWEPFHEREASRRTIYAFLKRSLVVPLLEVLDVCDSTRSADRRLTTTVAPQALSLFNGAFINRQAEHLAERLQAEAGADAGRQIDLAYRLTLCRPPTAKERTTLVQFLEQEAPATRSNLRQVCRVILNLNEFVYPE
jgi:hypothetical protein